MVHVALKSITDIKSILSTHSFIVEVKEGLITFLLITLALEKYFKRVNFYVSSHLDSIVFDVWNELQEFLFSFGLFLNYWICSYFIRGIGALPFGI